MVPGLIIAAPASGAGKTTVTLGLLRHMANAGVAVASAKAGPDYIDPAFHAAASGRPCVNLDPWAMRESTLRGLVGRLSSGGELVLCEGVMGLFDGACLAGRPDAGSTADLAALTGWPVVLVVDAARQAASVGALLRGFSTQRADVSVAGVVFNRTGGRGHREVLDAAARSSTPGIRVLGHLGRDERLEVPERHLGLVQAGELPALEAFLDRAATIVAAGVDVAALRAMAIPSANVSAYPDDEIPLPPLGQRIAVAHDAGFSFAYDSVLAGWRAAGASVVTFSPLANEAPDARADAVYLPGGYPELHAPRLAASQAFLDGLRGAARRGVPVFGECGGYMVLGEVLTDQRGEHHEMAGLLPLETSFAERRLSLGYRQVECAAEGVLGAGVTSFRGHEFHYARIVREGPGRPLFHARDAAGRALGATGLVAGSVAGSFVHLVDRAEGAGIP